MTDILKTLEEKLDAAVSEVDALDGTPFGQISKRLDKIGTGLWAMKRLIEDERRKKGAGS